MDNKNIDWEDVENKIAIICYKFDNLSKWHEDLAQELRIHAYYVSDNYYDLYRKAIDFWRRLQTRQAPDIPYFDLEILGGTTEEYKYDQTPDIIKFLRKELTETTPNSKWDSNYMKIALELLDIIMEDIDPDMVLQSKVYNKSSLNHYRNSRLNLSWVVEETGYGYKQLIQAMKIIEDTVKGLHYIGKIDIPLEYLENYFEE